MVGMHSLIRPIPVWTATPHIQVRVETRGSSHKRTICTNSGLLSDASSGLPRREGMAVSVGGGKVLRNGSSSRVVYGVYW